MLMEILTLDPSFIRIYPPSLFDITFHFVQIDQMGLMYP